MAGRFRELMKKYGKVALGVHLSVSTVSITGLYVAIRNNVDVEAILEKLHMGTVSEEQNPNPNPSDDVAAPPKNRTAQLARRRRLHAGDPLQQGAVPRARSHHRRPHSSHRQVPCEEEDHQDRLMNWIR
ncbi:hypothetical protein glysoja_042912 [Glycine soja]|uniref:DUF1279 domain-containing protein n=1 Tax=Glycine soja TaxID=3848 RepID=A0A0B2QL08_GLYSO|nr:hypothetical protein glysoja_042912 [Glycine soja]